MPLYSRAFRVLREPKNFSQNTRETQNLLFNSPILHKPDLHFFILIRGITTAG